MQGKVVYVVVGRRGRLNDRIEKLVELRDDFERLVVVTMGNGGDDRNRLTIRPIPNPATLLVRFGLTKLKNGMDRLLYFPSPIILFVARCVPRLRKQISTDLAQGKDVCLITCVPPHDAVLVGIALKKRFPNLRWLIDWQDLWSYDENYFRRVTAWRRGKLLRLERAAFDGADLNIVTNVYAKQVLIDHYKVPQDRVIAIHHHFSRNELPEAVAAASRQHLSPSGGITIGFLGSLFKAPRVPGNEVVDVIRRLRGSGLDVELHVYGGVPGSVQPSAAQLQAGGIHLHGSLGHEEALREVAKCDFLLLVLSDSPNSRAVMSIKLPHYLLTGRSIIAIAPEPSAIASFIHATGSGIVVPANSDWFARLRTILTDTTWSRKLVRNEACIETFSWTSVAQDWRNVINADDQRTEFIGMADTLRSG